MTPQTSSLLSQPTSQTKLETCYGVHAYAVVNSPLESIPDLKKQLCSLDGTRFAPAFLKPSDEQTVVSLAAVLEAIRDFNLMDEDFSQWGIVSAPRFLGRINGGQAIHKFNVGGAWKASPLFVPHHSVQAVSGTISQALKIKGPNFGISGGSNALVEGLLTTLTLLENNQMPGLWATFSQCYPEPELTPQGDPIHPVQVCAIALGFKPVGEDWHGLRIRLIESSSSPVENSDSFPVTNKQRAQRFFQLTRFLEEGASHGEFGTWSLPMKWGCILELSGEN